MLIKLNEGEGLTIKANHSDESNSYVVSNINGKYLRMREFPSKDIPPKSEQGDSKNSSQAVQHLKAKIAAMQKVLDSDEAKGKYKISIVVVNNWLRQLSAVE